MAAPRAGALGLRPLLLLPLLLLLLAPLVARALPFGASSVLALRAGLLVATQLNDTAQPMFLDELDPTSGLVLQSIALPTAAGPGAAFGVLAYASSKAEGMVGVSGDGTKLVVAGYSAEAGLLSPNSYSWADVPRSVALIDCNGAPLVTAATRSKLRQCSSSGTTRGIGFLI